MDVAILGCGYVGLELGRQLVAEHDEAVTTVYGVRRSTDGLDRIREAGFEAVRADLQDLSSLSSLPSADAVVFAASSDGRDTASARATYVDALRSVVDEFGDRPNPPDRLVYTSSTGIYGDHGGDRVDEETPIEPSTPRAQVLADAEAIALDRSREYGIDGTVTRFAGLYGPGRYRLERYLDGPVTDGILNMVHRDDAAGAVSHLLTADRARNEVVLVVDDEPVSKWAFADWLAKRCERDPPPKRTLDERLASTSLSPAARERLRSSKRCANDRLRSMGYRFSYPTFREGYEAAIENYRNRGVGDVSE